MISQNLKNFYFRFSSRNLFVKTINFISFAFANLLIFLINLCRPLLGPGGICPFEIGCTQFAILQLQTNPTTVAVVAIAKRLLSCNPISIWIKRKKACSHKQKNAVL